MKNYISLFLALFLIGFSFNSQAQIEFKINPIGALFDNPELSGEFLINDNIGIEGNVGLRYGDRSILGEDYTSRGVSVKLLPRYYFNPKHGADQFYAGMYGKVVQQKFDSDILATNVQINKNRIALGFFSGFKWLGESGVLLDVNAGLGRAFKNEFSSQQIDDFALSTIEFFKIDFIGSISLGYRIGGPKS